MKYNKKLNPYIISFLVSAVLSAAAVLAIKYYIPFSNETAGSYAVATIFGDSIKVFLIKILSVVACVLALITFLLRSRKRTSHKVFFPSFMIVFSVIWLLLPLLSSYTISRYTGSLITQTVTGIAIIANAVFFMLSVFFAGIAAMDLIYCIVLLQNREQRAGCSAMLLCGVLFGIAVSVFASSALQSAVGLNYVFVIFGAVALIVGIFSLFLATKGNKEMIKE